MSATGLGTGFPGGPGFYYEPLAHVGIRDWVLRFLEGTGFTGSLGFDFIETAGGELYALECNPRMTSGVLLFPEDGRLGRAMFGERVAEPDLETPVMLGLAMWTAALPRLRSWGSCASGGERSVRHATRSGGGKIEAVLVSAGGDSPPVPGVEAARPGDGRGDDALHGMERLKRGTHEGLPHDRRRRSRGPLAR